MSNIEFSMSNVKVKKKKVDGGRTQLRPDKPHRDYAVVSRFNSDIRNKTTDARRAKIG